MENRGPNMYVFFLPAGVGHHVQHTPGHDDRADGGHAERCEFRGRTRDVHEHRRSGQGAQSQSVGSEPRQNRLGRSSSSQ